MANKKQKSEVTLTQLKRVFKKHKIRECRVKLNRLSMVNNLSSKSPEQSIQTPVPKQIAISKRPPTPPPFPPPPCLLRTVGSKMPIKKLNWKTILPYNISKYSVWIKSYESQQLGDDMCTILAENFALKPTKKILPAKNSNVSLKVIDIRNAQNILIGLRALIKNSSYEEIKKYILCYDTTMLNVGFIDGLIKNLQMPNQIQLLKLKSDGVQLIDVEEFLANLCDIHHVLPRLHCMKFKIGFDDMARQLESDIKAATDACDEVITCQKFHIILHLILLIGNFMNGGSHLGQAVGFELPVLANLDDVKSIDNRRTLLHFLVEHIEEKQPDLMNFGDELCHLHKAAHVNTDDVEEEFGKIDKMLEFMKTELKSANEFNSATDDTFYDVLSSFTSKCHDKLQELKQMKECMQIRCIKVANFFAFDLKKYQIAECFKDITTFKYLFTQKSTQFSNSHKSQKK